jgi:hypothetical protein
VIVATISAFFGDNPRQSEIANCRGLTARANCKKCLRVRADTVSVLGDHRVKTDILYSIYLLRYLESKKEPIATKPAKKFQLKLRIASDTKQFLNLKYFDPYINTPVELMHTL